MLSLHRLAGQYLYTITSYLSEIDHVKDSTITFMMYNIDWVLVSIWFHPTDLKRSLYPNHCALPHLDPQTSNDLFLHFNLRWMKSIMRRWIHRRLDSICSNTVDNCAISYHMLLLSSHMTQRAVLIRSQWICFWSYERLMEQLWCMIVWRRIYFSVLQSVQSGVCNLHGAVGDVHVILPMLDDCRNKSNNERSSCLQSAGMLMMMNGWRCGGIIRS